MEIIERGILAFFYRQSGQVVAMPELRDVAAFGVVMLPAGSEVLRYLHVREKRLPESTAEASRAWVVIDAVSDDGLLFTDRMLAETRNTGGAVLYSAVPVGIAQYQLVQRDERSLLAYRLEAPLQPGPAQALFRIQPAAALEVAIRNPLGNAPGYPGLNEEAHFADDLRANFADRDWIPAVSRLLNSMYAQLWLTGLPPDLTLQAGLSPRDSAQAIGALYQKLGLDLSTYPRTALTTGDWPEVRKAA